MFDSFRIQESLLSSWIPLIVLCASAFLLLAVSFRTFTRGRWDPRKRYAIVFFALSGLFFAAGAVLFICVNPSYQRYAEHINPGIRVEKPVFFGRQTVDGSARVVFLRGNYSQDLKALPWYSCSVHRQEIAHYLGCDKDSQDGFRFYFQWGGNIGYFAEKDPILQYSDEVTDCSLEYEMYRLREERWKELGFLDRLGPYVSRVLIPSRAKNRHYHVPPMVEEHPYAKLDIDHIY